MSSSIYGLYDPRISSIRYIGKTTTPLKQRLSAHISEGVRLNEGRRNGTAVYRWIAKLLSEGVRPEIKLLEACDEEIEDCLEIEWIANMRLCGGPQMLNGTDGGTGGRRSEETKAKMSAAQKELWKDPEIRAARIKSKPHPPRSDEFREHRSESQKQKWQDPEYHASQTKALKTRPLKTHCKNNHEYTPENTWISPSTGWRRCRTCDPSLAGPPLDNI